MHGPISSPPFSRLVRAAQYLRASTKHQQYSIANQAAAIALYASAQNIAIVRSFIDDGISGTSIRGRFGLLELLHVVESGLADFELVIVFDVSRWGRFRDADEGAHYEYVCKGAGISVRYCSEQFKNDNSPTSNLLKALKRTMASEYSRELSVKVLAGQSRLVRRGFWMSGGTPFGFQRAQLDKDGKMTMLLKAGEHKCLKTDRIVLVPGLEENVRTVRQIFDLCTQERKTSVQIAKTVNAIGWPLHGHPWSSTDIYRILTNPVYAGTNVFCRSRSEKFARTTRNPKEKWVTRDGAFPPIIELQQFQAAEKILAAQRNRFTKPAMLEALRDLWQEKGTLSETFINAAVGKVPGRTTLRRHFGSLTRAYRLVGFQTKKHYFHADSPLNINPIRTTILDDLSVRVRAAGASVQPGQSSSILINERIMAKVKICRPRMSATGQPIWPLLLTQRRSTDVLIACRLKSESPLQILDYYVIPSGAELKGSYHVGKRNNPAFLGLYRMDTLQPLIKAFARTPVATMS